jgi:hypothetical protein
MSSINHFEFLSDNIRLSVTRKVIAAIIIKK